MTSPNRSRADVMPATFHYTALLAADESGRVTSLLAHQTIDEGRLRAVMWSGRRKAWIYAPAIVANYLYDEDFLDRTKEIDRPTAERLMHHRPGSGSK